MARDLKLTIGAVNITTHPHSTATYKALFKAAFAMKLSVHLMGQRYAILGSANAADESDNASPIFGEILCYTRINSEGNWLDLENIEILDDDEKKRKIRLPKDLMPDSLAIDYVFYPKTHMLFFEVYHHRTKMRPQTMGKFLRGLLNAASLQEQFGEVNVTVIPSQESLEQILRMPRIGRLNIVIRRPNADDQDDIEKRVLKKMAEQHVIRIDSQYVAGRGDTVKPDQSTLDLAHVASKNGVVVAHGQDADGNSTKESTSDHPMLDTAYYNEKTKTARQALVDLSRDMMQVIKRGLAG
jgi:hypothetical protein